MKKTTLLITTLSVIGFVNAQVGINTEDPKATLDVKVNTSITNKPDGFIAPRLSGNDLKAKDNLYTTEQTGTIVYATAASSDAGVANAKTINVAAAGYYYFDGAIWQKINSGSANSEPWHVQNTATPATSNTQNIYQNGNVAVGFSNTDPVSDKKFEVKGTYKIGHELDGLHHNISSPIVANWNGTTYTDPGILQYVGNTTDVAKMISSIDRDCPGCTEKFHMINLFPLNNRLSLKAADYSGKTGSEISLDDRGGMQSTVYRYGDPSSRDESTIGLYGGQADIYVSTRATPDGTIPDTTGYGSYTRIWPEGVEINGHNFFRIHTNGVNGYTVYWPTNQPTIGNVLKVTAPDLTPNSYVLSWVNESSTISNVQEYADNAAAVAAGLTAGRVYRTGDILKIVH